MMNKHTYQTATKLTLFALLAFVSQPSFAQTPPQTTSTCASIKDDGQRLACYDALFRQKENTPPQQHVATIPDPQEAPKQTETPSVDKIKAFGKHIKNPNQLDSINIVVTESYRNLYGKWVFITTNSQVWQQTDSKRTTIPSLPANAVIKRSTFGAHTIVFEGRRRAISVKRRN